MSSNRQKKMNKSASQKKIANKDMLSTSLLERDDFEDEMEPVTPTAYSQTDKKTDVVPEEEEQEMDIDLPPQEVDRAVTKTERQSIAEIMEVPNNTDRSIDFNSQKTEFLKKTDAQFPFTNTVTEDAMYLDQQTICALEFHHYQNDCKYVELIPHDEMIDDDGNLVDSEGNPMNHHLDTQLYQPMGVDLQPMDNFPKEGVQNFYESPEGDILKTQKYLKNPEFMRVEPDTKPLSDEADNILNKVKKKTLSMMQKKTPVKFRREDIKMIEPIIALYRVNNIGRMIRLNETSVKMGRKFFPAKNGNMTLTRSTDKRCISLVNFDQDNKDGKFFKLLAWSIKLDAFNIPEEVNEQMSLFYKNNFATFDQLVEVRLVCNCKMVQLTYVEVKERSLEEQQDYELEIENHAQLLSQRARGKSDRKIEQFSKRQAPRKAQKYVFFDAKTGELIFEYGGVMSPQIVKNANGEDVEAFVLGVSVKEIREESFDPKLIVYVAGDFLEKSLKKEQVMHNWAWLRVSIGLYEIKSRNAQQRVQFIDQCIANDVPKSVDEVCNFYLFPSKWILQQRFNWEMSITCGANRRFDQVLMINQPVNRTSINPPCIMINGPKFRVINKKLDPKKPFEVPYFQKTPDEATLTHGRNIIIKDCIFYKQTMGTQTQTICMRLTEENINRRQVNSGISIVGNLSTYDTWLHQTQKIKDGVKEIFDIFQTISVDSQEQSGVLQTRMTVKKAGQLINDDDVIVRYTKQFYEMSADLPFIAYNLGGQKILLQSTMKPTVKKAYIINIPEDERFLGFVDFNNYVDIGFYPKNLRIECCQHFLFLTTARDLESDQFTTKLNLLLADPFTEEIQVALFKSKGHLTLNYFKESDQQIKTCVQANMVRKIDAKFSVYLWTQFPDGLSRSKFMVNSNQLDSDPEDVSQSFQKPGEEDTDFLSVMKMLPNPMIQDSKDFIYYVMIQNGVCKVFEGNPRDPYEKHHTMIWEIKADDCFAFTLDKGKFYFMDNSYNIYELERFQNNRNLQVKNLLSIKEIQRLDFKVKGIRNNRIVMCHHYSILENKIFYHYDDENGPYPEGIMESEELIPEDRTKATIDWIKGPISIRGSNRVFNVYKTEKYKSFMKIIMKPDATEKVIINDFMNACDYSSYMPDGKIFLKIGRRFMIFSPVGAFIQELHFKDDGELDDIVDKEEQKYLREKGFDTRETFLSRRKEEEPTPTLDIIRKNKPTILNFLGLPFRFQPRPKPPKIEQNNKMEILQMSANMRWFLFINLMSNKMFIYELCEYGVIAKGDNSFFDNMPDITVGPSTIWEFKKVYELKLERSVLWQHMYIINVDPVQYFRSNRQMIKVCDDGEAKFTFVETMPQISGAGGDNKDTEEGSDQEEQEDEINCRVVGAVFKPQDNGESLAECFTQTIKFPAIAKINLKGVVAKKITNIEQKINNERSRQCRLPPKLFDYGYYETLIDQLDELELKKCDDIYSKIVNENLLIVWSGSILKFTRIQSNKGFFKKKNSKPKDMNEDLKLQKLGNKDYLKDINLSFDPGVEIIKIMETMEEDIIQIITFNHDKDVIQIITWDFKQNIERNMLQVVYNPESDIGYNVIKGMNQKMNYLIEKTYITDLEYNIPLWQCNVDQNLKTFDQVKLFQDNSRFLGVEKASCLYSQNSRMDIHLWQTIHNMNEKPADIRQSTELDSINMVFDGTSLFHYFAAYPDLIEEIHQKYDAAKQNGTLTPQQKTLPLQILNPDLNGKTAIYLALQSQSPKSFECMIDMLKCIHDRTITKMMLKSLAVIFSHESIDVVNFFQNTFYKPPLMQEELFVPWKEEMEQFVFPCHTSVITRPQLLQKLEEIGIRVPPSLKKKKVTAAKKLDRKTIVLNKRNLRSVELDESFDTGLAEGEEPLKRVSVEALDFDWIFDKNNAKVLLRVLANDANDFALTQRSVKIFIDLMWDHYQPAIIKYIFFPYLIYMVAYLNLMCNFAYKGLENLKVKPTEADEIAENENLQKMIWINIAFVALLFIFFAQQEVKSMFTNGLRDHFSDVWNTIDAFCLGGVLANLIMMVIVFHQNNDVIDICLIRTIAGFSCFFMWIKIFYWMRLFPSLAYYVNLIKQTIVDVQSFLIMCLFILCAFANFFYVLNQNFLNQGLTDDSYFDTYYGWNVIDSMLSMYELGVLGNYDVTLYRVGYDKDVANIMFFLCTFVITVVFLNMIIAIMGETFAQVLEVSEQRGLREQIVLIDDHSWLLNLKNIFKGQKYIIVVKPAISDEEDSDPVAARVKQAESVIIDKVKRQQTIVTRKVDQVDINTRYMIDMQNDFLRAIMQRIIVFEGHFKQQMQATEEEKNLTPEQKVENQIQASKKKEMIQQMTAQLGGKDITEDNIYDIALQWMEVCDTDRSGFIDRREFADFFRSISSLVASDTEINHVFDEMDESGDNQISVEEFAKAIMRFFLTEGNDGFSEENASGDYSVDEME